MGSTSDRIDDELDVAHEDFPGESLHRYLAEMARSGPVVPIRFLGFDMHLVNSETGIRQVLTDSDQFPGGATYSITTEPVVGPTFISMDGDDHQHYRSLATPAFRSRAVSRFVERELVPLANELVDRFEHRGSADLVPEFTGLLPYWVIGRKLGLPVGTESHQRDWAEAMLSYPMDPDAALRASASFQALIEPVLAERRASPGEDVLSRLLAAPTGEGMDDAAIIAHVRLLYAVGATTTADALSNMFATLTAHPAVLDRALTDPEYRDLVVEESLRYEPPVPVLPRMLTRGGLVDGIEIEPGSVVLLNLAGVNRDPAEHVDPHRFDPGSAGSPILSFGFGAKFCPGNQLARQQMRAALDVVFDRLADLELVSAAPPSGTVLRSSSSVAARWSSSRV